MDCYLLAGGHSRRMGRSKSDLPFGGSDFLTRVSSVARAVFENVWGVQRAGGKPVGSLPTLFEPKHDADGPIFGVLRSLQSARGRCFILAIDYPLITAEVLQGLRLDFETSDSPMLVPMWRGRPQLLCAGYSSGMGEMIEGRIAAGRFDLRGLIDQAGAKIIPEDSLRGRFAGEPLMNVNTPEDLNEAENHERQRVLASR